MLVCTLPSVHGMPYWQCQIFIDEQDGEAFVPAVMSPVGEDAVHALACFDAIDVSMQGGHLFVPLSWLAGKFPEWKLAYDAARRNADTCLANAHRKMPCEIDT